MPTRDELAAAATEVAAAWDLEVASVELVSWSENAVYCVETPDGDRVVLRLHRPGYNTPAQMASELVWVESLQAAGLDAPVARRTPAGDGHVAITVGDEVRQAGVIEWVNGTPVHEVLGEEPDAVAARFGDLGSLAARIRIHAQRWQPPPGFDRRRWDADGLVGPDPSWGRFWEVETLSGPQRSLFASARESLHEQLSALPLDGSRFGLIHADLHLSNVLVDLNRLIVIDFDDAGFGWYAYELAVSLHSALHQPWFDQARTALVAGYRTVASLGDDELAALPAFLTVRSLMLVGWLAARPELGQGERLPILIERATVQAERYLSGE